MVQLPKPFPKFFKLVDKPTTAPDSELSKAEPIYIDGLDAGGGGSTVTAADITDATAVGRNVLKATDAAAARTAIGAGTGNGASNLVVATTAPVALAADAAVGTGTTAARADHVHPLPTAAQVGAAATTHTHAATAVTVAGSTGIVGANVQLVLADLAARVVAAETAIAALQSA